MKKALLFLFVAVAMQPLFAQDSTKTLFKSKGFENFGIFLRGGIQYSQIAKQAAWPVEGSMGLSFSRKVRVGLAFESLVNNISVKNSALIAPYTRMRWQYSNFGAFAEYAFFSKRLVSISPGAMLGFGTIGKHPMDGPNLDGDGSIDDSQFFVFKPYVNINLNLTKLFGLYITGGYRLAAGEATQGISDKRLSGPFGSVGIKFEITPEMMN